MRISDWSSDVCSSDLLEGVGVVAVVREMAVVGREQERVAALRPGIGVDPQELPGRRRQALELLAADEAVHHRVELPAPGSPRDALRREQAQPVNPAGRDIGLHEQQDRKSTSLNYS